jgi:hypothetical protein
MIKEQRLVNQNSSNQLELKFQKFVSLPALPTLFESPLTSLKESRLSS